jgi:REP element-mobilizing transposase RayT
MATIDGNRGRGPLLQKPGHLSLRRGRVSLENTVYLVTTVTDDRIRYFEDVDAARAAARCFEDAALLRDARMLAWVLMPDHAHLLVQLGLAGGLDGLVNRIKSASARQANRTLGRGGRLWAPAFHDHALRAEEDLQHVARYVVANPLRAGLVERVGDYPYRNAIWI